MTAPPTSIAAASRAGAESIEGANPYPDGTPEAKAWQVARDAVERLAMLGLLRECVEGYDATIEQATVERAETLAEIARLEGVVD